MARETPEERALVAAAERLGQWAAERLRDRLAARPDPTDHRIESIWPVIVDWYAESAPSAQRGNDWFSLEVAFQTGDDDDPYPIEPPRGLDESAQWFNLDFQRIPSVPTGDGASIQSSAGLSMWFSPAPSLLAMLEHPEWDTGNLLGFDCLGDAGPDARAWCAQPVVAEIIDAFAGLEPVAVVLFDRHSDERLH